MTPPAACLENSGTSPCNSSPHFNIIPPSESPQTQVAGLTRNGGSVETGQQIWWGAHVESRREWEFATRCQRNGIDFWLPCNKVDITAHNRTKTVDRPIFTGYVFFAGGQYVRQELRGTSYLSFIEIRNQARFLRDRRNLERAMKSNPELGVYYGIPIGVPCKIRRGPMAGIECTIERIGEKRVPVVHVFVISGMSPMWEVSLADVEPIQ